jgi:hypothetical protein
MILNSSGQWNTAVGSGAMNQNTTGSYNVAVGFQTLDQNTSGFHNVAVGLVALGSNRKAWSWYCPILITLDSLIDPLECGLNRPARGRYWVGRQQLKSNRNCAGSGMTTWKSLVN